VCLSETCNEVRIVKHLSDSFTVQNALRQRDDLTPLLSNFSLEYAIRKVQVNQMALKLNGIHQFLAYTGDVNLLGDNMDTIKKSTETLIDASNEVGPEINVKKTNYMLLSRHHNLGKNLHITIANRLFENMSHFKYLESTLTTQNLIHEKIQRRIDSGNVCYHSVQNLLSYRLLSKSFKIRICTTIVLPVVLHWRTRC
jgi:hypothetical protein